MKKLIILILAIITFKATAQDTFKCSEGEISFFSESTMENIDARNKNISSFINTTTKEVVFVVPVRNFKFKNSLMEEHFNEKYMESEKYSDATFQGKINEDIDFSKDGVYKVTATGKMKMHGVAEKTSHLQAHSLLKATRLTLKCEFDVTLKDYNITGSKSGYPECCRSYPGQGKR